MLDPKRNTPKTGKRKVPTGSPIQLSRSIAKRAQKDFPLFASLVLRNEQTGRPVKLSAVHYFICREIAKNSRLIIEAAPELGKTQYLVAYALFVLGNNPRETIAVLSAIQTKANDIVQAIRRYIEDSAVLRIIFPNLRPGAVWTDNKLRVEGAGIRITSSVTGFGMDGDGVLGNRFSRVLVDDIDNNNTIQTPHTRKKSFEFVSKVVTNRITAGGQFISATNAWHEDDVNHRLAKSKDYRKVTIPLIVNKKVHEQWPNFPIPIGRSIWPEQWPAARIREIRRVTIATAGVREWNRMYLCIALSDGGSLFREEDFLRALEAGDRLQLPTHLMDLFLESRLDPEQAKKEVNYYLKKAAPPVRWQPEIIIAHGIDLATGVNNDKSAIVSLLEYVQTGEIRVLYADEGDWHVSELLERAMHLQKSFGGYTVVESAGIQKITLDLVKHYEAVLRDIVSFPTQLRDKIIGPQSIAGDFAQGKVIIPSRQGAPLTSGLEKLIAGLSALSTRGHSPDIAMAALFAFGALRAIRLNNMVIDEQGMSVSY